MSGDQIRSATISLSQISESSPNQTAVDFWLMVVLCLGDCLDLLGPILVQYVQDKSECEKPLLQPRMTRTSFG